MSTETKSQISGTEATHVAIEAQKYGPVQIRESDEPIPTSPRCPQCGAAGEFGYRDVYRAMRWFCPRHRLAQFWADARIPEIVTNNGGVLTDDNDHQQIDCAVAQPAAGSLSDSADGLSWHRPNPDVNRPRLVCGPAGTHIRLTAVALDRTPHFDAAGRFIHPCSNCGREAILGTQVNVVAGQLGIWYCGACKPPSSHCRLKTPGAESDPSKRGRSPRVSPNLSEASEGDIASFAAVAV
jgi:hypothetical protein